MAGLASVVFLPVFLGGPHEEGEPPQCRTNLKKIGQAVQMYLQDNDQLFPPVQRAGSSTGWLDALQPYVKPDLKVPHPFQCDSTIQRRWYFFSEPTAGTDYFFNRRLLGVKESSLASPSVTVQGGDGDNDMNALSPHYTLSAMPPAWATTPGSPARRHLEGEQFCFADGHVKWFQVTRLPGTVSAEKNCPTFMIE